MSACGKRMLVVLALCLIGSLPAMALTPADTPHLHTRSPVGLYPSRHNLRINGLALGFLEEPQAPATRLRANGLVLQLNPAALYFLFASITGNIRAAVQMFRRLDTRYLTGPGVVNDFNFEEPGADVETTVSGVALGTGLVGSVIACRGVAVGLAHLVDRMAGLQLALSYNEATVFSGVAVAIRNHATWARGVQIGLLNTCREGGVIQIGLLNRIGKRVLPFLNFQFRRARSPRPRTP